MPALNAGGTGPAEPRLVTAARELLDQARTRQDPGETTLRALQDILLQLHEHLEPRLGDGGFRNLVQLAHRRSVPDHPALEQIAVARSEAPILESIQARPTEAEDPITDFSLVELLARLLGLIRDVAQDQDWELVDLWPGLEKLKESGIPLRPDKPDHPRS